MSETPEEIAVKAPRVAGPPPGALEEELRRLLGASPRLRALDRLIEAAASMKPRETPPKEAMERLSQALRLARNAAPETIEATLRDMPRLPREALRELTARLLEMERQEFSTLPDLAAARDARGTALESADRLADLRLVNQLAQLRNEGVRVIEIPVRFEGRLQYIPLRVVREGEKKGAAGPPRFGITVDADLSRLGLVRAHLETSGKTLRVRLRARDRGVRRHLEKGASELVEALRAQGFEPVVTADTEGRAEAVSIFDVFAAPGDILSIDVHA